MNTTGRDRAVRRCLRLTALVITFVVCAVSGSLVARAEVITQEQFALTLWQELSTYMVFEAEEAIRSLEENYIAPVGGYDPKAVINEEFVRDVEIALQQATEMGLVDPARAHGVVALVLQSHREYDLIGALQEQVPLPAVRREAPITKYPQIRKGQPPPVEIVR